MRTLSAIKQLSFLLIAFFVQLPSSAQDPAYTEAFLSPIYLNPAATGAGEYDLRICTGYRRQWWLVPSNFNSMTFSVDKHLSSLNSGIGLLATHSSAGYLNRNGIYGTFAYTICAGTESIAGNGGEPKWFLSGGMQFGVAQTRLDYSKLVFADQLNTSGIIDPPVSAADPPVNSGRFYPDFAAGCFFNYDKKLLLGLSAHHINRPDESLTSATVSPVPVKWTGNFVCNIYTDESWALNFSGIAYKQATHSRYQLGLEATHSDYSGISVGLFYGRGSGKGAISTAGVTVSLNLFGDNDTEKIRVGLGHDAQAGSQGYLRTGGSSELGMVWDHRTSAYAESMCKPRIDMTGCPPRRDQ